MLLFAVIEVYYNVCQSVSYVVIAALPIYSKGFQSLISQL